MNIIIPFVAFLLLAPRILAQEPVPTAEQCRSDREQWSAELIGTTAAPVSRDEQSAKLHKLPFGTLAARVREISFCATVTDIPSKFQSDKAALEAWEGLETYDLLRVRYDEEKIRRLVAFIRKNNLEADLLKDADSQVPR